MPQNVITLNWDRYVFANSVDPDQMPHNVITLSTGTDIPNSVYPDQMQQNVITLSIGTDIPNSVYPDQMQHNVAPNQGLHCLPYIQQWFGHIKR